MLLVLSVVNPFPIVKLNPTESSSFKSSSATFKKYVVLEASPVIGVKVNEALEFDTCG